MAIFFRAHWTNASSRVSETAKHVAEIRYAQWMDVLCEGDIQFLRHAYNMSSRHHPEYVVLDTKAKIGISSFMSPHEIGHAHFALEFFEGQ